MQIIIIGSGWYGCHMATKLAAKHHTVKIIEKNNHIFSQSSYYNQNRLHLGFHYPRNFHTRHSCKDYFHQFLDEYPTVVEDIDHNWYVVSNASCIDFQTYKHILDHEGQDYRFIENDHSLQNIDGEIFEVNEKIIHAEKARAHFEDALAKAGVDLHLGELFENYTIKVNGQLVAYTNRGIYECDLLLDCTYNQLHFSRQPYIYERTISLIYKQIQPCPFQAVTVMDGLFPSLYPRDLKNYLYTLTDVEWTPLCVSRHFQEIADFSPTDEQLEHTKEKMEEKIQTYIPDFKSHFEYHDYFLSNKTKQLSKSDCRDIVIEEVEPGVLTVNCGKIYGIFKFEKYVMEYIEKMERTE